MGSPNQGDGRKVFVIDEIGKMELFSQPFIREVRQTLDSPGWAILGTIPVSRGRPLALVEEVRVRRDVRVFTVRTPSYSSSANILKEYLGHCHAFFISHSAPP